MTEKKHISIVVCGHVDAGKSTTTGRLIYELGGLTERELKALKEEAKNLDKESFFLAFAMDSLEEERRRGVTIQSATKEFFTPTKHYSIIDAPGHTDFIKNMITGASQADIALLMVPADGNFATAIAAGNQKAGEIQGQTRQHALLINLLGVKQLIVGVNKMDSNHAGYKESRYNEIKDEVILMLNKVGWKKEFVANVPIIPISGWVGDNLTKKSENMLWWNGVEVSTGKENVKVVTLLDALENYVQLPQRQVDVPLRCPISGIYKIKGAGDVLTGRLEQGSMKPGDEAVFLPTHTNSNSCEGKIFSMEMHHKPITTAVAGDNIGMNVRNLRKENMPRVGDIMIHKKDNSLQRCKKFTVQVQVLTHPGELKVGYSPIAYIRTSRSAVKIVQLKWKVGKETGGKKIENPPYLKANEMAELVFEPLQPLVVERFSACEGLGRVAILEGASVVMLGKVVDVEYNL